MFRTTPFTRNFGGLMRVAHHLRAQSRIAHQVAPGLRPREEEALIAREPVEHRRGLRP